MSTNQKVLPFEIKGRQTSDNLVIFLHGFPDKMSCWNETISKLNLDDSLYLNISYPNYCDQEKSKYGQQFKEIQDRIKFTIDSIDKQYNKTFKKILVAHDWGAYHTYNLDLQYPKYFDRLITLDIANFFEITFTSVYSILLYQIWLIIAFCVGIFSEKQGDKIAQSCMKYNFSTYPYDFKQIKGNMCYYYAYFWKDLFVTVFYALFCKINPILTYKPSVNLTYLYGKDKSYMFHNNKWLNMLKKNNYEIHAVSGDHWVQANHPQLLANIIKNKLKEVSQK